MKTRAALLITLLLATVVWAGEFVPAPPIDTNEPTTREDIQQRNLELGDIDMWSNQKGDMGTDVTVNVTVEGGGTTQHITNIYKKEVVEDHTTTNTYIDNTTTNYNEQPKTWRYWNKVYNGNNDFASEVYDEGDYLGDEDEYDYDVRYE